MTGTETEVQVLTRAAPDAASLTDFPDVLKRIYAGRGVNDPLQLDRSLRHLLAPGTLTDIDRAAARLARDSVNSPAPSR